ncbi:hypothetical protein NSB25_03400 [Acetatifactor muris]|uniref:Uncharacterized protein n=1 Tax=Acetatifactor muris TaxID=879566 RepID=A0A2K4ZCC0_9FIRM|nr:hypothetical protein [Acetatifactor muris]MCR2046323.1 hypothetical protein [Acetatifactor muris]SOY28109.1 hypothetical protein AMURIS_00817 [Acetatifactor muris]
MGFLSKIWKRKKYQENVADDWENIVYDRDTVNFGEEEQRSRYITNCLEQINEAGRELNLLTGEYSLVTSYLTDMEEIEALPKEEREVLNGIAERFVRQEEERARYRGKKNRMTDADYYRLRKQEDELQEGIAKLRECETYGTKVKQDLQRLDRERHAYEFRRQELDAIINNMRGMIMIFLTAFIICIVMLLVLQFGFEMNTKAGYLIAVAAVAVAITVVWVKYTDGDNELHRVEMAVNKLILLQNKVKIRYVNNKNLTDYLYIKYSTDSAAALERLWKQYQEEKEERREYAETESKREYYRKQLLSRISNYRVTSPERWLGHPEALLDKREMVEMRHELILRRQALRKQMDYNNDVAEKARKEIRDVADKYPAHAAEIQEIVRRYKGEDSDY